jgi:hypothetical protein
MTGFSGSPRVVKGGIVLVDPTTGIPERLVALQYNPDSLTRSFQVMGANSTENGGDRSEALRIKGPPVETIKLEAELDMADQLEFPDQNPDLVRLGLHPYLSALELCVFPSSKQLIRNDLAARAGTLEIAPMETALTLFVWSINRVLPVRITELSVTEEAFDPNLNPLRAKVSLGMRVLTVNDLGFNSLGGGMFLSHLIKREVFAYRMSNPLQFLNITGLA